MKSQALGVAVAIVNTIAGYTRENWMLHVRGAALLSKMTIPGTHDAGALYGGDLVETQTQSITSQLESGVRFLDVRGRHMVNLLYVYHESFDQYLSFMDVQLACVDFLRAHPSECIVMMVKDEGEAKDNTRSYKATFDWYVSEMPPGTWYLGELIPTLDEVRGKIVLLRRFDSDTPEGINCSAWAEDATFTIHYPGVTLWVQDGYKVPTIFDINDKWNRVKYLLDQAAAGKEENQKSWYLNFTSGSSGGAYPYTIAKGSPGIEGLNYRLDDYLSTHGRARYGTIPMDFFEEPGTLVPRVIDSNDLENCWTQPMNITALNQAASRRPPAMAMHGETLHLVFVDSYLPNTDLWSCSRSKMGWSECVNITAQNRAATIDSPALASFGGKLHMAFLDSNPERSDLWICSSVDGRKWSDVTNITTQNKAASRWGPAVAVFNGKLYMAFLDSNPDLTDLWICSSENGRDWSEVTNISKQNHARSRLAPALAAFGGKLYMSFVDSNPDLSDIWICSWDGEKWSECVNVKGQNAAATKATPSLGAIANNMCMAFVDDKKDSADIWVSTSPSGDRWSYCADLTPQNQAATKSGMALAFDGFQMHMVFVDSAMSPVRPGSGRLWYCSILPLP